MIPFLYYYYIYFNESYHSCILQRQTAISTLKQHPCVIQPCRLRTNITEPSKLFAFICVLCGITLALFHSVPRLN